MDETAAQYEPDQHALPILGGGWCRVEQEQEQVQLLTDSGDVARTVDLADVVAVRRGGPDLTLVRRAADPITLTLTAVEHARTFESAVEEIIAARAEEEAASAPPRRWWQFWRRR